jgi:hypothetical protein
MRPPPVWDTTVTIADTEAKLELSYTGTDLVDKLFIGITEQADGVCGHTDSGADNGGLGVGALDAHFGPGTVPKDFMRAKISETP